MVESQEIMWWELGLSNIFPKGIPVAKVIDIAKLENSHFLDIQVKLLFDASNLDYLFILNPF